MDGLENGANELTVQEIEALFAEDAQQETPPATEEEPTNNPDDQADKQSDVTKTKAFAKRLKESTDKAVAEERETIAKSLGFSSYSEMIKDHDKKVLQEKGIDPEQANDVIQQLVDKRLSSDPRLQELEQLKKQKVLEFAKSQLQEISELTDGEIKSLNQLSKETIELFRKTGDLKQAYLQVEGVNLIKKIKSNATKGTTDHMQQIEGQHGADNNTRPLTVEERRVWKVMFPNMTEEELNKKTVKI